LVIRHAVSHIDRLATELERRRVERLRHQCAILNKEQIARRRVRRSRMYLWEWLAVRRVERSDVHDRRDTPSSFIERRRHVKKMTTVGEKLRVEMVPLALRLVQLRHCYSGTAALSRATKDASSQLRHEHGSIGTPRCRALMERSAANRSRRPTCDFNLLEL